MFINTDFKFADYNKLNLVPKYKANRFDDKKGNRFYYFYQENNELVIAAGITSWLKGVKPESKYMTDWKIDIVKSGRDWNDVLNNYAEYGTAMHACYADIMIEGRPKPENIERAIEICRLEKKNPDMVYKDCIAFVKWMQDFEVEPLLIEAILPCQSVTGKHYAMTVDLLCRMNYTTKGKTMVQEGTYVRGAKKGQPKMVKKVTETKKHIIASVDFKSNFGEKEKKSFYDDHKFQLMAASKAIKQNFGKGFMPDKVFNFSPNNWTKEPTYTFYEHKITQEDIKEFELLEELASVRNLFEPQGKFIEYVEIKTDMNIQKCFNSYSYREYVLKNTEQS